MKCKKNTKKNIRGGTNDASQKKVCLIVSLIFKAYGGLICLTVLGPADFQFKCDFTLVCATF